MAESGAASFTAAVITSPNPARSPRSPPRGRIQDSLRAPLLSATSRMVRIPIMVRISSNRAPAQLLLGAFLLADSLLRTGLNPDRAQIRGHLHRLAQDFLQLPPLQLAQRAAFDDADHIAHLGLAGFIVRVKLLALADDSLVHRVRHAAHDLHHDGLGHLVGDHLADFFVLGALLLFGSGHFASSLRSRCTVSIRARSFRSARYFLRPSIWPIDIWKRNRK